MGSARFRLSLQIPWHVTDVTWLWWLAPLLDTKKRHDDNLVLTWCPPHLELQHGYTLRSAVEMCGCAAPPRWLQVLCCPTQCGTPGPGAHDDPWTVMLALLQAGHHGLTGDGAKLIREGAIEDQNVHGEDPLADGCGVLQDKALVDKENATWEKAAKESRTLKVRLRITAVEGQQPIRTKHKHKHQGPCCVTIWNSEIQRRRSIKN